GADEPDRDGYRNLSMSLRGGYALTDALSVEGTALRAEGENHYDGYYNYSETLQQVLGGKVRYTPSERFTLTANVGRADNESDNYNGSTWLGAAQTHRNSASVQADVGIAEGQLLSAGVDWSQDNLDGSSAGYLVDSRDNTGVFVQYQGRFGAHHLQASVRNDDNEQFGNHTTGSVGWGMALGGDLRLNASYGTGFKAPTFNDLYYPFGGNPDLQPEESKSFNVGIGQYKTTWNWTFNVFQTRIDSLTGYDSFFNLVQAEEARIRGAELTFAATFAGWDLSTQFSYADPRATARENAEGGANPNYDNLLPRRAPRTGRIDLDRSFGAFRVGTTVNGASARYDNAANTVRVAGYGTLDLRVEYAVTDAWTLQARATNVFDRDYETIAWYNQPGREYG
ncbi:MAG: TonB-dependent receptor, partial [Oxalobacteraceae bacterium]